MKAQLSLRERLVVPSAGRNNIVRVSFRQEQLEISRETKFKSRPAVFLDPARGSHPGVEKSLIYLQQNFSKDIQTEDLARVAGLSRRGLHKAFLKHIGFPPATVVRDLRVKAARYFLAYSTRTIGEIAEATGFHSSNSFWVAFKAATGVSPQEYRDERKF